MDLRFVRIGFLVISALLGSQVIGMQAGWPVWLRLLFGAASGTVLVLVEAAIHRIGRVSVRERRRANVPLGSPSRHRSWLPSVTSKGDR